MSVVAALRLIYFYRRAHPEYGVSRRLVEHDKAHYVFVAVRKRKRYGRFFTGCERDFSARSVSRRSPRSSISWRLSPLRRES